MERIDAERTPFHIIAEHQHRYQWVSRFARGRVLDVACGIGYGSEILLKSGRVSDYLGIDQSEEAIRSARERFNGENSRFLLGNVCHLDVDDRSIDTVISLETLEHLDDPLPALAEFKRVLKDDGLFIGSVPTKAFEELCEEAYGKNIFHQLRFSLGDIKDLLLQEFASVEIFTASMEIGTRFKRRYPITAATESRFFLEGDSLEPLGSFVFICSGVPLNEEAFKSTSEPMSGFAYGINLAEYEKNNLVPLRNLVKKNDDYIVERDKIIEKSENMIFDMTDCLKKNENIIMELHNVIKNNEKMILERDGYIDDLNLNIYELNECINNLKRDPKTIFVVIRNIIFNIIRKLIK